MATYSIRPNAGIAAQFIVAAGTTVLYTAPANGYAIVQLKLISGAGGGGFNIGGINFAEVGVAGTFNYYSIYIGPSQVLTSVSSGTGLTVTVTGVQFT